MCQERYNYRGMNVEFIQRTIEGYGRVEDVIVDGEKLTQIAVSYLRDCATHGRTHSEGGEREVRAV